jgi:hypothetical protein
MYSFICHLVCHVEVIVVSCSMGQYSLVVGGYKFCSVPSLAETGFEPDKFTWLLKVVKDKSGTIFDQIVVTLQQ